MKAVFAPIDKYLTYLFNMKWVSPILVVFLIMYGGIAAPAMPQSILKYFDMTIVKVAMLAGALIVRHYAPTVALMIAVVFLFTMILLKEYNVIETTKSLMKGVVATATDAVSDTITVASDTVSVAADAAASVVGLATDTVSTAVDTIAGLVPGDEKFGSFGEPHSTL